MTSDIRIVCFDLGGVIVGHHRTWSEGCAAAGLEVRGDSDSPESIARRLPITIQYCLGRITHDDFTSQTSQALDGMYSPQEIDRIHHAWLTTEYPDVGPLITRLQQAGVRTACLSNTNEGHWRRMLNGEFPTVVTLREHFASHLMGCLKPGDDIYRAFEKEVRCAGNQILFLDDQMANVQAAQSLDWRAEHVDHTSPTAPQIESILHAHDLLTGPR